MEKPKIMKVQLKSIKVLKTINSRGTGEPYVIIKCSKVIEDIDAFRQESQAYFNTIFSECIITLDYREVK